MKKPIEVLIKSHTNLLRAAEIQLKSEPRHTVRAVEDAIEATKTFTYGAIRQAVDDIDNSVAWETAAHLLAKSIQNPDDKNTAWLAVMAYTKVNGSTTPKV